MGRRPFNSTNDMCRIFGVGRETLRHYENLGLLKPDINPENGYRMYTYWDVGTMVDVLKYRSVGLQLKDVKKAMFEMDFPDVLEAIKKQNQSYKDKIKHYQLLEKKTAIDMTYLSLANEHLNEIQEMDLSDLFIVPYDKDNEDVIADIQVVFQNSEFFSTAWKFDDDDTSENIVKGLGFVTEKEFAKHLHIKNGISIGNVRAVGAIVDIAGRVPVTIRTLDEFNAKAKKKHKNLEDKTYAILLSRFYDKEGEYHQYVFAFKKKK